MGRLYIMEKAGVETHPKNTQLETVNSGKKGKKKEKGGKNSGITTAWDLVHYNCWETETQFTQQLN